MIAYILGRHATITLTVNNYFPVGHKVQREVLRFSKKIYLSLVNAAILY